LSLIYIQIKLNSLDETTFIGTDQLSILNLSKNKIKTLPRNLFKDMINFNEINLSGNNISNLDMNVFNHLTSLTNFNFFKIITLKYLKSFEN
jgi:Leucine-rich repeat (LRR) protein